MLWPSELRRSRLVASGVQQTQGAECGDVRGQLLDRHLAGFAAPRAAGNFAIYVQLVSRFRVHARSGQRKLVLPLALGRNALQMSRSIRVGRGGPGGHLHCGADIDDARRGGCGQVADENSIAVGVGHRDLPNISRVHVRRQGHIGFADERPIWSRARIRVGPAIGAVRPATGKEIRITPVCPGTPIHETAPVATNPSTLPIQPETILMVTLPIFTVIAFAVAAHRELAKIHIVARGLQGDAEIVRAGIQPKSRQFHRRRLVAIIIFRFNLRDARGVGGRIIGSGQNYDRIHRFLAVDITFVLTIAISPAIVSEGIEIKGEESSSQQNQRQKLRFHTTFSPWRLYVSRVLQMGDLPREKGSY